MALPPSSAPRSPPPLDRPGDGTGCRLGEIIDYRDDHLPPDRRAAVGAHLATCADCRQALAAAERLLPSLRAWIGTAAEAPGTALRGARAPANHWEPAAPSRRFWLPLLGVLLVIAIAAMLQVLLAALPRAWGRAAEKANSATLPLTQPR